VTPPVLIAPQITRQPLNRMAIAGQNVSFPAAVAGSEPLTYQWERSADGQTWSVLADGTSATYSFMAKSGDGGARFHVKVSNAEGSVTSDAALLSLVTQPTTDLGPNVIVFDPSMSPAAVQTQCASLFDAQKHTQFGTGRKAVLFMPGTYSADVHLGFYTQVLGLGASPDDVNIAGAVRSTAYLANGNATCNFWRGCENLAVTPTVENGAPNRWAVSQGTPFRRMHIKGSLVLSDTGTQAWSSGGFISDSRIDGTVDSGSQQQWLSRSSEWGNWVGANWNMVFVGVKNAPGNSFPSPPYTVVEQVPVVREKPFLTLGAAGDYAVFVPALRQNTAGTTWGDANPSGETLPISQFHIAQAGTDTAGTLNAALASGKHLLLTPGIYHLNQPLQISQANTVVLGLGFATLVPDAGVTAVKVADVDGVKIAGLLIDAGPVNSPVLMEVGPSGSSANHAANPTCLQDLLVRIGGAGVGQATTSLVINSHNVIGDDFWLWRADHGTGTGWTTNRANNGLIVNGDDVTLYGLFVEHYQGYQTLWNGNGGRVYFYQSEIPYDVPDLASWSHGTVNGYASYSVADTVTSHQAWGVGVYSYFSGNHDIRLAQAISVPVTPGVKFHHMVTVCLAGYGEITHVINDSGATINGNLMVADLSEF